MMSGTQKTLSEPEGKYPLSSYQFIPAILAGWLSAALPYVGLKSVFTLQIFSSGFETLVQSRVAPDTDLAGYPAKSAYRSLLYIDIILFVNTIFDFKQFF